MQNFTVHHAWSALASEYWTSSGLLGSAGNAQRLVGCRACNGLAPQGDPSASLNNPSPAHSRSLALIMSPCPVLCKHHAWRTLATEYGTSAGLLVQLAIPKALWVFLGIPLKVTCSSPFIAPTLQVCSPSSRHFLVMSICLLHKQSVTPGSSSCWRHCESVGGSASVSSSMILYRTLLNLINTVHSAQQLLHAVQMHLCCRGSCLSSPHGTGSSCAGIPTTLLQPCATS